MIRRLPLLLLGLAFVALAGTVMAIDLRHARDGALPLADTSIIRREASAKHLDPALIAAVIDTESHFEPRPSSAGAQGLMQLLPSTAEYLAGISGGYAFHASDLSSAEVNIAYGSYYLRYLLDHYKGDEMLALAAYNGGVGNVDSWLARERAQGRSLTVESIPFPQTREYVRRVMEAQQEYRSRYGPALGV